MYSFSYLEPVCCSMSSSNCCFLTCIQISQEMLFSSSILGTYGPGEFIFQCDIFFAFSYCSWGSQSKNTKVVCHSLLQWTTFCQNSPPWPKYLGLFSFYYQVCWKEGFPGGSDDKESACKIQETWVGSLGREDALKKGLASHSSIFAWRILWTEKPGRLQSVGSQRDTTDRLILLTPNAEKNILSPFFHNHPMKSCQSLTWPCLGVAMTTMFSLF